MSKKRKIDISGNKDLVNFMEEKNKTKKKPKRTIDDIDFGRGLDKIEYTFTKNTNNIPEYIFFFKQQYVSDFFFNFNYSFKTFKDYYDKFDDNLTIYQYLIKSNFINRENSISDDVRKHMDELYIEFVKARPPTHILYEIVTWILHIRHIREQNNNNDIFKNNVFEDSIFNDITENLMRKSNNELEIIKTNINRWDFTKDINTLITEVFKVMVKYIRKQSFEIILKNQSFGKAEKNFQVEIIEFQENKNFYFATYWERSYIDFLVLFEENDIVGINIVKKGYCKSKNNTYALAHLNSVYSSNKGDKHPLLISLYIYMLRKLGHDTGVAIISEFDGAVYNGDLYYLFTKYGFKYDRSMDFPYCVHNLYTALKLPMGINTKDMKIIVDEIPKYYNQGLPIDVPPVPGRFHHTIEIYKPNSVVQHMSKLDLKYYTILRNLIRLVIMYRREYFKQKSVQFFKDFIDDEQNHSTTIKLHRKIWKLVVEYPTAIYKYNNKTEITIQNFKEKEETQTDSNSLEINKMNDEDLILNILPNQDFCKLHHVNNNFCQLIYWLNVFLKRNPIKESFYKKYKKLDDYENLIIDDINYNNINTGINIQNENNYDTTRAAQNLIYEDYNNINNINIEQYDLQNADENNFDTARYENYNNNNNINIEQYDLQNADENNYDIARAQKGTRRRRLLRRREPSPDTDNIFERRTKRIKRKKQHNNQTKNKVTSKRKKKRTHKHKHKTRHKIYNISNESEFENDYNKNNSNLKNSTEHNTTNKNINNNIPLGKHYMSALENESEYDIKLFRLRSVLVGAMNNLPQDKRKYFFNQLPAALQIQIIDKHGFDDNIYDKILNNSTWKYILLNSDITLDTINNDTLNKLEHILYSNMNNNDDMFNLLNEADYSNVGNNVGNSVDNNIDNNVNNLNYNNYNDGKGWLLEESFEDLL